MKANVHVVITNYIPADEYIVEVYRKGGVVPLQTKSLAPNAGADVYFYDVESTIGFEVRIGHKCGTQFTYVRGPITAGPAVEQSGCNCPSGFVATIDKKKCMRILTEPAQVSDEEALAVAMGPNEVNYAIQGARVYKTGYGINGQGAVEWDSFPAHSYWASLNNTAKGRLNIAGVWNAANVSLPLNKWIGFTYRINVPVSKIYYIGMAGDNFTRFKVNGTVIVDQQLYTTGNPAHNFQYWHIYPVFLNAGENIIEPQGFNTSSIGCFAAEIYDCTLEQLMTVTVDTEAQLNRLFSTLGQSTFTNRYFCKEGWALDLTGEQPICKQITYVNCGPLAP